MPRVIAVAGTHGIQDPDDWSSPKSEFFQSLAPLGWFPVSVEKPYKWDTALDGVAGKNYTWEIAGLNLYYYVAPPLFPEIRIPARDTYLFAFSHGVNVAIEALALGLKARGMISVCPPVRGDMRQKTLLARKNVERWINLHGDWRDLWAVAGAVRDGHLGIRRKIEVAENILVPGGHGAALRDKRYWPMWAEWLEKIR